MAPFDYVSVILSVVVSLAFAHLLTGMVRLIQTRDVKFSVVHAGWIGLLLFWCVDYWFSTWLLHDLDVWTLAFVAFLLLLATVLYLACGLAIPPETGSHEGIDLQAFHDANRRRYLAAIFCYLVLGIFANLLIGPLQSAAFINIGQIAVVAVAWTWGERRIQLIAVAAEWILTGMYAYHYIPVL